MDELVYFTKIIKYLLKILLHFILNAFHMAGSTSRKKLGYVPFTNVLLFVSVVKEEMTYCNGNLSFLPTTCLARQQHALYLLS